jgi:hypothetical protein
MDQFSRRCICAFLCSKYTCEYGEKGSPDVVIDVVICSSRVCGERKSPGSGSTRLPGLVVEQMG